MDNQRQELQLTMHEQLDSSITQRLQDTPSRIARDSIGSNAEKHRNYSLWYGEKEPTTEQTTSQNATQLMCTKKEAAMLLQQLEMNRGVLNYLQQRIIS
jgi:hypothetical protein